MHKFMSSKIFNFCAFVLSLSLSSLVYANPNAWSTTFQANLESYYIESGNKDLSIKINCNGGSIKEGGPHALEVKYKNKIIDQNSKKDLVIVLDGYPTFIGFENGNRINTDYREAANDWRSFIAELKNVESIEIVYDYAKIGEINPIRESLQNLANIETVCSPFFDRE